MAAIPASATVMVTAAESTSIVTQVDTVDGTFEIRDPVSGDLVGYLLAYDRGRQQVYGLPQ